MKKDFKKDFNECPVCALKKWLIEALKLKETPPETTNRFFEQLAKELKDREIARPEWTFCLNSGNGVVADETRAAKLLVGSKLPTYAYKTDVCMECGCVYAIHLSRGEATVGLTQAQQAPPNRAEKRRMERGGFGGLPFGQG